MSHDSDDSPETQEARAIDDVLVRFRHMVPWASHDGQNSIGYDVKTGVERTKASMRLIEALTTRWVEMRDVMPPLPLTLIALKRGLQRHDLGLHGSEIAWLLHTLKTQLGASDGHWRWDENDGALH